MRFRDLFEHVAVFTLVGAFTFWWTHGRSLNDMSVLPGQVVVQPPGRDELPPPRRPRPPLIARLAAGGFTAGQPVFIRIFKSESQLELWIKRGERYDLFDTYPVCAWSGLLGPKLREGDGQSPEGFYEVGAKQLNPDSDYNLAFNLGFPNAYDRVQGRSGSGLMVHGNCASIGCYAMTDYFITEIYALVAAALKGGQRSVPVHVFPFRMTDAAMTAHEADDWLPFWRNLKEGYDAFEAKGVPPAVFACGKAYAFNARNAAGCARIAAW